MAVSGTSGRVAHRRWCRKYSFETLVLESSMFAVARGRQRLGDSGIIIKETTRPVPRLYRSTQETQPRPLPDSLLKRPRIIEGVMVRHQVVVTSYYASSNMVDSMKSTRNLVLNKIRLEFVTA